MNKTYKGLLAAVLVLVIVLSAVIIAPATAAESEAEVDTFVEPTVETEAEVYDEDVPDAIYTGKVDLSVTGEPDEDPSEAPSEAPSEDPSEEPSVDPAEDPTEDPYTIGAVTTIKRTTTESKVLGLKWNAASGAEGYHVYWRDADKNKDFVLLSTVKDTTLTIRNLKPGHAFYFKIAAYKTVDGTVIEGKSKTVKGATVPAKVSNFRLTNMTNTATEFKWSKVNLSDGYLMYRKVNGEWSLYKKFDKNTLTFTDKGLKSGKAYYYAIYAYRKDVGGTLKSTNARINTVAGMKAPTNNGTKLLLRKVYLNWTKVNYAQGYEIFYSTNHVDYKFLARTKGTSYTTKKLKDGVTYYFKVYPYRLVGASQTKVRGMYYGKKYTISNTAYGKSVPSTYIEVSIEKQHMWYYINDELYVSTDVVTGNYGSMGTPRGYWKVNSKASPCTLSGSGYSCRVQYWMAFIGSGWGIHDASWRSSFGGNIYKGNGSHGCINTPYKAVQKMYKKVKIGTPVIVY